MNRKYEKNIAYLVFNEAIWGSVLRSQSINIIKTINCQIEVQNFYFVSFLPIYNIIKNQKEIQNIKSEFNGIKTIIIPIPFLFSRYFLLRWFLIPFFLLITLPSLFYLCIFKKVDLFHCRGYQISIAALIIKKILDKKLIFDPRSLFPEENIIARNWTKNSLTFKMWKFFEILLLKNSDGIVAVSNTFSNYIRNIYKKTKLFYVPLCVDISRFVRDDEFRKIFRMNNSINEKIVFCYSGSLGHWNDPEIYAKYIIALRKLREKHIFLFIIHRNKRAIASLQSTFNKYYIKYKDEYLIVHSEFSEMPKYLSIADFGLQFMGKQDISRLGIKTIEYIAIGLPIITNSNAGGARAIVEKYGVGAVLDLDQKKFINKLNELMKNREEISIKCRLLAEKMFSTKEVRMKYAHIYKELLSL